MVKLRGVSGALKQSYMVVARLHAWSIEHGVITAQADEINQFALDNGGPFSIAIDMGRRQWVWTAVEVLQVEPEFKARLDGSPTVR